MLELINIKKDYPTGPELVHALKGIDIQFRKSEFVAILGPSGCGKTTTLNIIGGLDQYTEGDLVINGVSTKNYKDRDWDAYRNHSVGFVFQSYNLIPHQTVLQNVELALTLSGVSKAERHERAKRALEQVGLGDQLKKKPAEMSGGQMQRVAIARALVNDPDIILADEPTGALDSKTSVQVMEILAEVARERLVVMVTHNAEIAETYATRTITMLDGLVTGDSAPLSAEEYEQECAFGREKVEASKKTIMPKMKLGTSFGLSLKNLFTKKGRTILTAFAGSIGIIGIALVVAVSNGTTNYINRVQEETLSSYPLTIEATHTDLSSLATMFMGNAESEGDHSDENAVYPKSALYELLSSVNELQAEANDLAAFKDYIEDQLADPDSKLSGALSGVGYSYDLNLMVYTKDSEGNIAKSDTLELLQEIIAEYFGMQSDSITSYYDSISSSSMSSMFGMSSSTMSDLWQEMLPGQDGEIISPLVTNQYDLVYGSWPTQYNEAVLIVDENNELNDVTLYALGLKTEEEMQKLRDATANHEDYKDESSWTFEEICAHPYRVVLSSSQYTYDEATGTYKDLSQTDSGMAYLYENGIDLKITGIIRPSEDSVGSMLTGAIGYTSLLTNYAIEQGQSSEVIAAQKANPDVDVLTGLPFKASSDSMTDAQKATSLKTYLEGLNTNEKAAAYIKIKSLPSDEYLDAAVESAMSGMTREKIEALLTTSLVEEMGVDEERIADYLANMEDEELLEYMRQGMREQIKAQYASAVETKLSAYNTTVLATLLDRDLATFTDAQCALYYSEVLEFSETTYEDNLALFGSCDLSKPSSINLYASTFSDKDIVEEVIAEYNEGVEETSQIKYTDYVGLLMSSVTTIINAITYVLLGFIAVSLIVSSIMIGVITLISVQERTKEIGILRAIGASKKNISTMFNAETVIIGFVAGLIGVLVTYLLCIPLNIVIHALTEINSLSAALPVWVAVVLVCISVFLTLIAGIIPSRSAAKKDPVVALRTE